MTLVLLLSHAIPNIFIAIATRDTSISATAAAIIIIITTHAPLPKRCLTLFYHCSQSLSLLRSVSASPHPSRHSPEAKVKAQFS